MGCLQSKAIENHEVGDRRRLSVLKGGQHDAGVRKDDVQRPQQPVSNLGVLFDLLPAGEQRFSVLGQQAVSAQKGFENKNEAIFVSDVNGVTNEKNLKTANFGIAYACKKGLKPESPNQDDFFLLHVAAASSMGIYGVFDGHGPYGHEVSHFAHQQLPLVLLKSEEFKTNPREALKKAFAKTHTRVQHAAERLHFDCQLSGTTGTVVCRQDADNSLWVAHVGDSRAVMAQETVDGKLKALDLSKDHKPGLPEEKARITKSGGQVRCLNGDVNERVFIKNRLYPGLAMSRSIGDLVGASVGVTSEPEVSKFSITKQDKFMLICSDGVWEFISSQEAIDIVSKYDPNDSVAAAEALAQEAWDLWIKEEGNVVDDITVILVYLQGQAGHPAQATKTQDSPEIAEEVREE